MRQAAYVYYKISTLSPLSIISIRTKRQISNKIITLPDCNTGFILSAEYRHNIRTATAISEKTVIYYKHSCKCASKEKPYMLWNTVEF